MRLSVAVAVALMASCAAVGASAQHFEPPSLTEVSNAAMSAHIVPDLWPSINLKTYLYVHWQSQQTTFTSACDKTTRITAAAVDYDLSPLENKNMLPVATTRNHPTITFDADPDKLYSVMFWDSTNSFGHMLVMNIFGNAVDSTGQVLLPYTPPLSPFPKHNPYILSLHEQSGFIAVDEKDLDMWSSHDDLGRRFGFNATSICDKYDLGAPVGLNWIFSGPNLDGSQDMWCAAGWQHIFDAPFSNKDTLAVVKQNIDPLSKLCGTA